MKRSDSVKSDDLLDPGEFWDGERADENTEELAAPPPRAFEKPPAVSQPEKSFTRPDPPAPQIGKPITPAPPPGQPSSRPPEKTPTRPPISSAGAEKSNDSQKIQPFQESERSYFLPVALVILAVLSVLYFFQNLRREVAEDKPDTPRKTAETEPAEKQPTQQVTSPVVSAPEVATGRGELRIVSDPPGAVVFIDDQKRGATPTVISELPLERELQIRIEAEGYRPWTQKLIIDRKSPRREISAGLLMQSECSLGAGWLHVVTEPKGATVEINGKRMPGSTPLIIDKICAGEKLVLKLQKAGFRPAVVDDVMIAPEEVRNISVEFKK